VRANLFSKIAAIAASSRAGPHKRSQAVSEPVELVGQK
jgi:hypothetical protein